MILRQPDITGISPVGKIMPVLAVSTIGETGQEQDFRALQFTKGQEYFAKVISRIDSNSFNVRVDGTVLKMNLGNAAQVGQNLLLKYIQDSPLPTFLLANANHDTLESQLLSPSKVSLSPAANLLGHYLEQAEQAGATPRFEAHGVITQTPGNPRLLAQDLKQAVASSGLFYESHLNELIQGQRSLSAIMQEPQNQAGSNQAQNQNSAGLATLVSQQLSLMENQRMEWRGEVWPGQQMDWDVYQEQPSQNKQDQEKNHFQSASVTEDRAMVSELTLHLPKLGKVSAKLHLENGHIRINLMAQDTTTLNTMRQQAPVLVTAMEKTGQVIDGMTVAADK